MNHRKKNSLNPNFSQCFDLLRNKRSVHAMFAACNKKDFHIKPVRDFLI